MKKLLMTVAILATGATAFGNVSTPVSVSLDVVTTSNLVLMEGAAQLNQIDLVHKQILLTVAKGTSSPSTVAKTFTAQTGDNSPIKFGGTEGATITYAFAGTGANGLLALTNGTDSLDSTLTLSTVEHKVTAGSTAAANTITSTIAPLALNGLTTEGTYTGSATLNVTIAAL